MNSIAGSHSTRRTWLLCALAMGLYQAAITAMNTTLFPTFYPVFLGARDLSTIVCTIVDIALAVVFVRMPHVVRSKPWAITAVLFNSGGHALSMLAVSAGNPVLLAVAACIRGIGSVWVLGMVSLAFVELCGQVGARGTLWALCAGWAVSYIVELALSFAPEPVQLVYVVLGPAAAAVLAYVPSAGIIEKTASSQPAYDLSVTNPNSFVPFGSAIFITLVLLKMSFGFAMTFASVDATPQSTILACVPALAVAAALALANRCGLDDFYKAAFLCVLAGFLLVNPLIGTLSELGGTANAVLRAGGDLTRMLSFMIVAYLGARNPINAPVIAMLVAATGSLGSVLGGQLGMAANAVLVTSPSLFALLLAGVVFAFVAYNVLAPNSFHFDKTAAAIEPVVEPMPPDAPHDAVALACSQIAASTGLTPRETEALELLAHGRNTASIMERMVVSRSTAKTHVRNVYTKLNVHSQQELIDVVERSIAR